jgi:hypothetical protein
MAWVLAFLEKGWKVRWMKWDVFFQQVMQNDFEVFFERFFYCLSSSNIKCTDFFTL